VREALTDDLRTLRQELIKVVEHRVHQQQVDVTMLPLADTSVQLLRPASDDEGRSRRLEFCTTRRRNGSTWVSGTHFIVPISS
jgi:hypothetical protein